MPVLLVEAATKILQDNGESITKDQVVLMHDRRYMDATFERLSDHDVESEDVIDILIYSVRSLSKSKQPDPDFKPGSPLDEGPKFYGVRRGRTSGIYRSWEECQTQVEGFSGRKFKSFRIKRDALDYMAMVMNKDEANQSKSKSIMVFDKTVHQGFIDHGTIVRLKWKGFPDANSNLSVEKGMPLIIWHRP
jgi:hypothetical protein